MSAGDPRLRVAVFGSPAFAVPVLERLHREHELILAVTQPDKPAGRGMKLRAPEAARRARELGVPVRQPARLRRNDAFRDLLAAADLDVAVTAAYGKILPGSLLDVPRHGFLNAHASLLPAYRGAAPIQWALIHGERETGISVMQTEVGLDTGPVRHVLRTEIDPDETAAELQARLSLLAADAVSQALALLARGRLPSRPQDHAAATAAPLLTREDGRVRWSDPARAIYDRWRGVAMWPRSWFGMEDRPVRVDDLRPGGAPARNAAPGTVLGSGDGGVDVAAGEGAVRLLRVTPPGRRTMDADAWLRGSGRKEGDRLA